MSPGIEQLYTIFLTHRSVSTDSRDLAPGSLFFALKGDNFDGNDFVGKALEQGAAYAVTDRRPAITNDRVIVVEDVLLTLQELSRTHRKHLNIPVLAITGTNGKTTTKELAAAVLGFKYRVVSTRGNLNNHIGVPLTLLTTDVNTEVAIVEMGANHPGEIGQLCGIACPTHGLITNIGKAHLDGFGGFEGIVRAKTELYRFLETCDGTAFVNSDDPLLMEQSVPLRRYRYGLPPAELKGRPAGEGPLAAAEILFGNDPVLVTSSLFGRHNATNIMAAAAIGLFFGVEPGLIRAAIASYQPALNRSQVKDTGNNLLILDAYNANPASMEAALDSFGSSPYPFRCVILGDMLELGADTDKEHLYILEKLETFGFEQVFLVGPVFTRLNTRREWTCFQDSELARMWFEHHEISGRTILLKGSRGIRLEKLVFAL